MLIDQILEKKAALANLKPALANLNVDDLDIDKLKTFPKDLKKLSYVVENDDVKKTVYDDLFKKVSIQTLFRLMIVVI